MTRYILVRLGHTVLIVLSVSIVVFVLTRLLPGETARAILGNRASPAALAAFNKQNGLSLGIPLQYWDYLKGLVRGNLGYSYKLGQPVSTLILTRLPKTIFLSGISLFVALCIAIPLGIAQAVRQGKVDDYFVTGGQFVIYSMPSFWLAIILILIFAVRLHVFPSEAPQSDNLLQIISQPRGLVLPVIVTAAGTAASLSRYMRSSAIEKLGQDYIRLARAKGLRHRRDHLQLSRDRAPVRHGRRRSRLSDPARCRAPRLRCDRPGLSARRCPLRRGRPEDPVLGGWEIGMSVIRVSGPSPGGTLPLGEPVAESERLSRRPQGLSRLVWIARRHKLAVAGMVMIVVVVLFCFVGPLLYHTNQTTPNPSIVNRPPSGAHPLGTDSTGYDELGRLMVGGQSSLEVGLGVGFLGTLIGILWGAVAGFVGGPLDSVMMRVVDVFMSIPGLLILILLAAVLTPNTGLVIVIFSVLGWQGLARLMRGETLGLRGKEFVQAGRCAGSANLRLILRHILPNAIGTIMVNAAFGIADAIIGLASLSFLGLGLPPPAANWGGMLSTATTYVYADFWWEIYFPGLLLVFTVLAFNFIGEALRDAFQVNSG
jgi:peptide/nickel transport system permease protein